MPVVVLDVEIPAWNEVVLQSVLFGIDMTPDNHRDKGNTVVELTGTWDKLNSAVNRIHKKQPMVPVLAVMESKLIE